MSQPTEGPYKSPSELDNADSANASIGARRIWIWATIGLFGVVVLVLGFTTMRKTPPETNEAEIVNFIEEFGGTRRGGWEPPEPDFTPGAEDPFQ